MPAEAVVKFVDLLRRLQLLEPGQLDAVANELQEQCAEPRDLARELQARGWLTRHQLAEIAARRAGGLCVGPYIILEPLAEDDTFRTFKARDRFNSRTVALKAVREGRLSDPAAAQRFQEDVGKAVRLLHPNVAEVYESRQAGEQHYLAAELPAGSTLAELLSQRGPLPVGEACHYACQAALGLQHAHENGLVGCDVRPEALLVAGAGQVKLLDVGLCPGRNGADPRADLRGLGETLHRLLTALPPQPGVPLQQLRPDVPPTLAAAVDRLLAGQGYGSAAEAAAALHPFCSAIAVGPPAASARPAGSSGALPRLPAQAVAVTATPPSPLPPLGDAPLPSAESPAPAPRRGRRGILIAALLLLLIGGGTAAFFLLPRDPQGPQQGQKKEELPPGPEFVTNSIGMKLAKVRPGTFQMGIDKGDFGWEPQSHPKHPVEITREFWIGAHEVSQAEFEKVMGFNPSHFHKGQGGGPDHPVEQVTWDLAEEFCDRLSALPEERKAGRVYRLPTEAEWEYACRAGTTTLFTFGPGLAGDQAQVSNRATAPVAQFKENAWGLWQTHGNVWEMLHDWYDPNYYTSSPPKAPRGPARGAHRGIRGGGYANKAEQATSATRQSMNTYSANNTTGFRIVCEVGQPFPAPLTLGGAAPAVFDGKPLAALDPAQIPSLDRFEWQPKELVAVLGQHRLRQTRYANGIHGLAVSGDGKWAAISGGPRMDVRLGHTDTLRMERVFARADAGGAAVHGLSLSPDGKLLASCTSIIYVWPVEGEKEPQPLVGHTAVVRSTSFSADGKILVSGGDDKTVRVWDTASGKQLHKLDGHKEKVLSVAVSPDGKLALSGGADGLLKLWDVEAGKELLTIDRDVQSVGAVAFSADGKLGLWGEGVKKPRPLTPNPSEGLRVRMLDVAKKAELKDREMAGHTQPVTRVAFTPDGELVISGDNAAWVATWDAATGKLMPGNLPHFVSQTQIGGAFGYINAEKGRLLVGALNNVRLFDMKTRGERLPLQGHLQAVLCLATGRDGKAILSGGADNFFRAWSVAERKAERQWGLGIVPAGLAAAPDGHGAAATGLQNQALVHLLDRRRDPPAGAFSGTFPVNYNVTMTSVDFTPDGKHLLTGDDFARVRLWDLETYRVVRRERLVPFQFNVPGRAALSADGLKAAVAWVNQGKVGVWDLQSGKMLTTVDTPGMQPVAARLSPDGRTLYAATADGKLRRWDLSGAEPKAEDLAQEPPGFTGLTISPDGKLLAASHGERGVMVYDAAGKKLHNWTVREGVNAVAFAPDGRHVITANESATLYVLRLDKK